LIAALQHKNKWVARIAANALGKIGYNPPLPELVLPVSSFYKIFQITKKILSFLSKFFVEEILLIIGLIFTNLDKILNIEEIENPLPNAIFQWIKTNTFLFVLLLLVINGLIRLIQRMSQKKEN